MLKLSLTNFRCWEEKELSIPHTGICLINGKSGKGKSTILNSILYCITGKLKNISTINKKYTKVKLAIDNMTITRTRGPNRLIVEKEENTYEDDQAQAVIDKLFGSEFSNTSYIDQDNINSFVFLSPSEKIEFLEKLLLSQHDIESIKVNIKDAISKTKLDHVSEESKITTLSSLLKNMTYTPENDLFISTIGTDKIKTTPSNIDKLLEKVKNNLEISTKNAKTLLSKIKRLEDEKLLFTKTIEKKKMLEFRLQELSQFIIPDKDNLSSLIKQKELYLTNKDLLKQKECKDKYDTLLEKNKKEIDSLQTTLLSLSIPDKKRIAILNKAKDLLSTLCRLEKDLEIDYDDQVILDESACIEKYKKDLSDRDKSYQCPSCSKHLKIHNNQLIQLDKETNTKSKQELLSLIQSSEQIVHTHKKNKILYEKREKEYNELFDLFETMKVDNDPDEIDKELVLLEKNNILYEETYKKIQSIENDRLLSQYKKDLEKYHDLKPIDEKLDTKIIKTEDEYLSLLDTIAKISEQLSQYNTALHKIQSIEKEIESLPPTPDKDYDSLFTSEKDKLQTYEEKSVHYKTYIDQLIEWNRIHKDNVKYKEIETSISTSQTQKENLSDRMRCLVKLKEHVKNAERKCISDFIDSLNDHASLYIEQFFPDEDIKVDLKTIQESKTGKEKISLNFEINYKQMVGDLSYLSGGEKDRVNLAFTLAFSELVNNRILLLDECISSLDAETTNVVLENLKEKYKGKLVLLVSHQANIGFFDSVVNI